MANTKISALTAASTPLAGTEVLPIVQSSATVNVAVSNLTAGRSVSMKDLTITGTGYVVTVTAASTTRKAGSIGNTGGTVDWGVESSAGGSLFTYAGAYTGNIGTSGATDFNICANGNVVATAKTGGDLSMRAGNIIPATAAKGVNFTANTPAAGMTSQLLNWYEEGTWTPALSGSGTAGTYQLATASGWYTRVGRSITVIFNVKLAAVVTGGGTGFAVLSGLPFNTATTNAAAGAVTLGGVNYTVTTNYVTVMPRSVGSASLIFEEVSINGAVNDMAISAFGTNDTIQGTLTYLV